MRCFDYEISHLRERPVDFQGGGGGLVFSMQSNWAVFSFSTTENSDSGKVISLPHPPHHPICFINIGQHRKFSWSNDVHNLNMLVVR